MIINNEIIEVIKQHRLPTYNEIPNVGLYLEQTAKYINEYLEPIMDTAITGSMISNYVKKKLVLNPVKKMYYREHIAQLIIIAVIKSVISLDKVKLVLELDGSSCQDIDKDSTEDAYMRFSEELAEALKKVFGIKAGTEDKNAAVTTAGILKDIVNTAAHKIYIDKLLVSLGQAKTPEEQ